MWVEGVYFDGYRWFYGIDVFNWWDVFEIFSIGRGRENSKVGWKFENLCYLFW